MWSQSSVTKIAVMFVPHTMSASWLCQMPDPGNSQLRWIREIVQWVYLVSVCFSLSQLFTLDSVFQTVGWEEFTSFSAVLITIA